jgi:outer membrane protein TolC
LANAVLQLKTKGQKAGTNSTLELIDAEVNLAKTKTEQAQSAYDYVKALADLLEVAGLSDQFTSYMARADLKAQ